MNGGERKAWQLAVQMIFQDPYASLNPRLRVIGDRGRGAARARADRRAARKAQYVARDARPGGPRSRLCDALPAPVLGRPAPAHRHRARAGGEAVVHRLRRGGGGARRLDPGAGAEPVHGAARAARPHLSLHQPQSRAWSSISRIGWRSCISAGWSRSRRPRNCSHIRTIPTPRPCWPRCRRSMPRGVLYKPIAGELPSPLDPPPGCAFHPRCPHAFARCKVERPALETGRRRPHQRLSLERQLG